MLCPQRIIEIPCGTVAHARTIAVDDAWSEASAGGLLADHSQCPAGEVGQLVLDGGDWLDSGIRLRAFGPSATFVLRGRRIADEIRLDGVVDFDAGDDAPAAHCEDGASRGSVVASSRAGDCFEVAHAPLSVPDALDGSAWTVSKQPLLFFLSGRYRDGFARVVQTPAADRARLAFTQPDQTYARYAASHATVVHSIDASNPTRVAVGIEAGTLPDPIACEGVCTGPPASGGGTGALVGMCLTIESDPRQHPIFATFDRGDDLDVLILEQDVTLGASDAIALPRAAWVAPCVRPGDRVEAWEPFVVTVAEPGADRAGVAVQGDGCPVLEGVQFRKVGGIRTFSSELASEGSDAVVEIYDSYAGCAIEGPIAVDDVYYVPGGTNGPYPLHVDNVRDLVVRRLAEQGFHQNGGGDLAVPHSAKLQDCAGVVLERHSVGWLANESPWMSPLDPLDERADGVPEGVGVTLRDFNIHDVWTPPGVVDGNGGPNFSDAGVARGVNHVEIHDGMIWNTEFPLVVNLSQPTSAAFVWNVVIGPPHWMNDAHASGTQVAISGGGAPSATGPPQEVLANSVIVGGASHQAAMVLGLQNWQHVLFTAVGEALKMDSFNAPIDRVRRQGMFYRQSGPTALAEYGGGGLLEGLSITRWDAMAEGTPDDPNLLYRDIVLTRFCRTDGLMRGLGVQSAQVPSSPAKRVFRIERLTLGMHCPERTDLVADARSAALYFGSGIDEALDADSQIVSVLAITGDPSREPGSAYGVQAVQATRFGSGGPAIAGILCSTCRDGDQGCSDFPALCLAGGHGWTRDATSMWNLESAPAALGVRVTLGPDDLTLVPGSPAAPLVGGEHLGAGAAGLAVPFPTLDDYGLRFADWSYRATANDAPDLRLLPEPIRSQLGVACADGADNDGDGRIDYPDDPGCRTSASTLEDPACQNGRDDDGDGAIDFDGGTAAARGDASTPADPRCADAPWSNSEVGSCGLGAEGVFLFACLEFVMRRRGSRARN